MYSPTVPEVRASQTHIPGESVRELVSPVRLGFMHADADVLVKIFCPMSHKWMCDNQLFVIFASSVWGVYMTLASIKIH